MIQRCTNHNAPNYKNYGGKGIVVCDEWRNSFEAFYEWAMSNGYSDDLTIDRIDNEKGYSPDNCRWATMKEQANNKRNTVLIDDNGELKTVLQISKETGLDKSTIYRRNKTSRHPD